MISQPPIMASRKNINMTTRTMDPMTINKSSMIITSTPTMLRSALLSTVKFASNHSCQTTPYTGTSNQHAKLQSSPQSQKKARMTTVLYAKPKKKVIIMSTALKTNNSLRYGFHSWQCTTANVKFSKDQQAQVHNVCLDMGCIMTLI